MAGVWLSSAAAGASSSAAGEESLDFLMDVLTEITGVTAVKDFGTEGGSGQRLAARRGSTDKLDTRHITERRHNL